MTRKKIPFFRKINVWLLPATYAVLLLALSSIPHFSTDEITPALSDKFWHMAGYMPLGFLLYFAIDHKPGPFVHFPAMWALVWGIGYSAFNEFYQHFIPGRNVDFVDLACNVTGAIIGTAAYLILKKNRSLQPGSSANG